MPRFYSEDFKGKELYYDLRDNPRSAPEGVFATPIFESDSVRIERECEKKGRRQFAWVDELASAIKRWEGFTTVDGKDIACTPENIKMLCESDPVQMRNLYIVIRSAARAQVESAEKN